MIFISMILFYGGVMNLKLQLQTLNKGNLYVTDYLVKMKAICDTLVACGRPVREEDQEIRQATPFSSNAPFGGMKAMVPTRPKLLMTIVGSPTLEQQIM